MPTTGEEDHPFKITWRVEDFSFWVGHNDENDVEGSWTPTFVIETLKNTEWRIKLSPLIADRIVACTFQRAVNTDVEDEVNIHYTFYTLARHGSPYFKVTGTVTNLNPGYSDTVAIIPVDDIRMLKWPHNLLSIVCEIRQGQPSEPVDFCCSKWKDELQRLSDDMRKLFETGYLSDLKLESDDGRRIAVHKLFLNARWPKLWNSLSEEGSTNRIAVHGVSGSVLYAFVSYLYSGTLSGSDVTAELFDFAVENAPRTRKHFHSRTSDICMRTQQKQEQLTFTWYADDLGEDRMPFFRALPLQQVDSDDLVVVLDIQEDENIGERCLDVRFSISDLTDGCHFTFLCTANLFIGDVCVISHSDGHIFRSNEEWHFPSFIPLSLLTHGTKERPTCLRVQFQLVISDMPQQSVVESCVTEFSTGSRDICNVELLASDFKQFFMVDHTIQFDLILRSGDGNFFSSRAVLSVRSRTFLRCFRNRKRNTLMVGFTETDSVTFAGVLEYVCTGWTKLTTLEDVRKMLLIAKGLCLFGLVEKCQQFIDRHPSPPSLETSVV